MLNKQQKMILWGLLIIITGLLLPLHSHFSTYPLPGTVGTINNSIIGLNLISGWFVLLASLGILAITIIPGGENPHWTVIRGFLAALTCAIVFFTGFVPIFHAFVSPGFGLLFLILGSVLMGIGVYTDTGKQKTV